MTTDKLIAELKLVSWVDRKPGMGSMDAVYLDDAIQIIRNHQPEPTQKQVDNVGGDIEKIAAKICDVDVFWNTVPKHSAGKIARAIAKKIYRPICTECGFDMEYAMRSPEHWRQSYDDYKTHCLNCALQAPQPTVEPMGESGEEGIFYRKLMIYDGRVYWLYPDNSHRGLTKADVLVINKLRCADEFKLPQPTVDKAELEKVRELVTQAMNRIPKENPKAEGFFTRWTVNPPYQDLKTVIAILDKLLGKTINDMEGGE